MIPVGGSGQIKQLTGCASSASESSLFLLLASSLFLFGMEDFIQKRKQFSILDFLSKQELITKGRPTPELRDFLQRSETLSLNRDWYTRKDWLCGCPRRKNLFCFSCLLFSPSRDIVWNQSGYCDLKNLQRSTSRREQSITHIQRQIAIKKFGIYWLWMKSEDWISASTWGEEEPRDFKRSH